MKSRVVDIDFQTNLVFDDLGDVYEVESYVDFEDTPCLPEEAVALYYIKNESYIKYIFTEYDLEMIENAFDSY